MKSCSILEKMHHRSSTQHRIHETRSITKERISTACALAIRRLREKEWAVGAAVVAAAFWGFILALVQQRERATAVLARVHRRTRLEWLRRAAEPYIRQHLAIFYRQTMVWSPPVPSFDRKRLLVLKPPRGNGEKGVLLVMFSEMLAAMHSCMDLERLVRDYTLVLEPSYPGFCRADLLRYTRFSDNVFVLCGASGDFEFLQRLNSNLIPVDLAPCDWVDPRVAEPYLNAPKEFDIVMNAIWASLKRHYVLFRMLARARRPYKVALIGTAWENRTRADIEREARYYGVMDRLTIFESITYDLAMEITCKSRVSMLLSLKEAGPRAIAESIFCDVPVVVPNALLGGIVKSVVSQTGIRAAESDLESSVERLLNTSISPRKWGIDHISCLKSSEHLNAVLQRHALFDGRSWHQDIATRTNKPECAYYSPVDEEQLRPYNCALKGYLR